MAAAAKSGRSARRPATSPTPERRHFTLSGPSRPLDHDVEAARRDLADIAVAGRWFAPHYADPEPWVCRTRAKLVASPAEAGGELAALEAGERFSVLELSGGWAWGYRDQPRQVGYVRADALRPESASS